MERSMTKKLCLVTLSNGTDVIGLLETVAGDDWATLWRPCVVRLQGSNQVQLVDLLRGPFMSGEHIELNMRQVAWIGIPPKELAAAYNRIKSGVILPMMGEPVGMNQ
jgi:hypothetical protein